MLASEVERLGEFGLPSRDGLILSRIDKVEGDPLRQIACHVEGLTALHGRMQPAEPAQIRIIQGLQAD